MMIGISRNKSMSVVAAAKIAGYGGKHSDTASWTWRFRSHGSFMIAMAHHTSCCVLQILPYAMA